MAASSASAREVSEFLKKKKNYLLLLYFGAHQMSQIAQLAHELAHRVSQIRESGSWGEPDRLAHQVSQAPHLAHEVSQIIWLIG